VDASNFATYCFGVSMVIVAFGAAIYLIRRY
jgi:hypothetical protein